MAGPRSWKSSRSMRSANSWISASVIWPVSIMAGAIIPATCAMNLPIVLPRHVGGTEPYHTRGLATIYVFLFVAALLSITRALPFGLALGVSVRTYYLGTVALAVTLAFVYGLALTVLEAIEQATGGWGASGRFFRVPWILDGPWYVPWLTSFVVLAALFSTGLVRARLPALEPDRPGDLPRRSDQRAARERAGRDLGPGLAGHRWVLRHPQPPGVDRGARRAGRRARRRGIPTMRRVTV